MIRGSEAAGSAVFEGRADFGNRDYGIPKASAKTSEVLVKVLFLSPSRRFLQAMP
jgi:hypothetical protein